jgi:CHAD domain-containing protein
MAYRLQPGESVREGLRRIAREELSSAAGGLREASARTRDDAIHEARKSVKKVRAILRLMRGELGDTYRIENRRLRDVARRLSVYRDGTVTIETLDQLGGRFKDDRYTPALAATRRGLVENQRRQRRGPRMTNAMHRAADALLAVSARVDRWRLVMDGPVALAPGMETAYRRGRAGLAAARRHARPEYCHEWRKRVKDHWYHLRLLESRWDAAMRAREKSLKELETWLGEHHNLEVLAARLAAEATAGRKRREAELCRGLIGKLQRELRRKALALGQRLYSDSPELFRKQLAQVWRPQSTREVGRPIRSNGAS